MLYKNETIKLFKETFNIKRITVSEIYRAAKELGFRDLSLFGSSVYHFGKWNSDKTSSKSIFSSNDRFKTIEFLINFQSSYLDDDETHLDEQPK